MFGHSDVKRELESAPDQFVKPADAMAKSSCAEAGRQSSPGAVGGGRQPGVAARARVGEQALTCFSEGDAKLQGLQKHRARQTSSVVLQLGTAKKQHGHTVCRNFSGTFTEIIIGLLKRPYG
jgi:hypothetical protein